MYAVLECFQQHDWRLVFLAAVICIVGAVSGISAYRRVLATRGAHRLIWIAAMAMLLGSGVWSTHFMAMLAFQREMTIGYGPDLTLLSLLFAVIGMGLGVWLASAQPRWVYRLAGGAVCGGAIALMHFVGVAAMHLRAELLWDPVLVVVSVIIAIAASAAAFIIAGSVTRLWQAAAAALLFVLAICGLHFTAMAAVTLLPTLQPVDLGHYGRRELAVGVAALSSLIALAGVALVAIERVSASTTLSVLRVALDRAPAAMAFFDPAGRLAFWNQAFGELLRRHGAPEKPGATLHMLLATFGIDPGSSAAAAMAGSALADARQAWRMPVFAGPSGRRMQPEVGVTADGGRVLMLTDITDQLDLVRREADVARESEARKAAEAANWAKSEFLATMSHEIRTPLNGILGMVQVMARDPLGDEQRERLEVIRRSGAALLAILNDVLDLSKIEAGKLEIEDGKFDLEELARGAHGAFTGEAQAKGLSFNLSICEGARGVYRGDSVRIRQILYNLVSNALKFTERGYVRVEIDRGDATRQATAKAAAAGFEGRCITGLLPDGEAVRISVSDTGIGVAPERIRRLFDKFVQADSSTTRKFGGTGLGLAICAQLSQAMGGAIEAASAPGKGSCFTLWLPLERLAEPSGDAFAEGGPTAAPAEFDARLRVLAAEDNPMNQLVLKTILAQLGVWPVIVEDGAAAVAAWEAGDWDLILMDVQMPVMDGPAATRAIRAREAAGGRARTPIIALTANAMTHQLAEYRAAGMDALVAKPIDVAELAATITAALDQAVEPAPSEAAVA